jgi:hypothetical protein
LISTALPDSQHLAALWQPGDQEAFRQAMTLPATVPCLDALTRAMSGSLGVMPTWTQQHITVTLSHRKNDSRPGFHTVPIDKGKGDQLDIKPLEHQSVLTGSLSLKLYRSGWVARSANLPPSWPADPDPWPPGVLLCRAPTD